MRDTAAHVALEQERHPGGDERAPSLGEAFADASWREPALRACSQAGLVNNLNDALAWGLVPLFLAAHGASIGEVGLVAGIYPAVWGAGQIWTGHWSDRVGRKLPIVSGMLLQAGALVVLAVSDGAVGIAALAAALLGVGTALVYPTLIAAISDAVPPVARAPAVGVYRFWRDMGYVAGGAARGRRRRQPRLRWRHRRRRRPHRRLGPVGPRRSPRPRRARRHTERGGVMSELTPERITAFFDRVAADWDEMRLVYYDEAVIERLAAAAELDETMTVADIGTGTGFVAAGLAGRVARVIGIDDSPGMLAEAERNLAELGATNVELRRGDIAALPLPDDSVDAAVANMVLHHATDPAAMLREMARVVRPGGTVAICDEVTHPYAWMREEHHDVWLGFSDEQINAFFAAAGLEAPSLEVLGRQ